MNIEYRHAGQFTAFQPSSKFPLHQLAYAGQLDQMERELKELRKKEGEAERLLRAYELNPFIEVGAEVHNLTGRI